ncbi:hypothetical protein KFK09_014901 [Dendrobium nobile]|uniref:ACT-like domain-containing protein n=1 Tax=Dendrobium nobile TaxID=94219 RepID=A0A8T3B3C4_DENNO|nr:hypothetical protein KFK09_014901 [Dendrobium nobile]
MSRLTTSEAQTSHPDTGQSVVVHSSAHRCRTNRTRTRRTEQYQTTLHSSWSHQIQNRVQSALKLAACWPSHRAQPLHPAKTLLAGPSCPQDTASRQKSFPTSSTTPRQLWAQQRPQTSEIVPGRSDHFGSVLDGPRTSLRPIFSTVPIGLDDFSIALDDCTENHLEQILEQILEQNSTDRPRTSRSFGRSWSRFLILHTVTRRLQVVNCIHHRFTRCWEMNGQGGLRSSDGCVDWWLELRIEEMGGRSSLKNELLCRFVFPERPGALMKFLNSFSPRWNISLFHYRSQGETGANVLVGLQVSAEDMIEFSYQANKLGYEYTYEMNNEAYLLLMQ